MICKCGYNFAAERLAFARGGPRVSESFAIVNDRRYRKFMKFEIKAWTGPKKKRLKAIGKAAQYVGTMYRCPECARLVVLSPDADDVEFYVREDERPCCSTQSDN
jgi:hypothetical protein